MSVWSMAAAAVLAGAATAAVRQEAQVAQPAPSVTVVAQAAPDQDRDEEATQARVSASFNHASVADVMDWLTKNGLSFVTADSELPKDATITLNVKDEPVNEVADAIASALGGHWERRGGMRIFRKGEGMFRVFNGDDEPFMSTPEPGTRVWTMPKLKEFKDGDHVFVMPKIPEMKEFDMPNIQIPDIKEMPGMDEESRKAMEKAFAESRKEMLKSGEAWKISKKAMEEARKEMERARKEHPEAFDGKTFVWGDGNKFYVSPGAKGFYKTFPSDKGNYHLFRPSISIDGHSFTKFVQSLSPDQRELQRRQGYLRASDLTENQRKMLGIDGRDKGWSITINKDGEEVTIKSD